jgi:hypothetical protein
VVAGVGGVFVVVGGGGGDAVRLLQSLHLGEGVKLVTAFASSAS